MIVLVQPAIAEWIGIGFALILLLEEIHYLSMSSTEKKPRSVSVNPILADSEVIKRFQNAYITRQSLAATGLFPKKTLFSHR